MATIHSIKTQRCDLRALVPADAEALFEILSDAGTVKFLNLTQPKCVPDAEKIIEEYLEGYRAGTKFPFAIIERSRQKLIGVFLIKLDLFDEDCFEYTTYLHKDFQGKGFINEVFPSMLQFAFEQIGTGNVRGFIMQGNNASAKISLKNKMILEKVFDVPGIPHKIESYLMTREQYNLLAGTKKSN